MHKSKTCKNHQKHQTWQTTVHLITLKAYGNWFTTTPPQQGLSTKTNVWAIFFSTLEPTEYWSVPSTLPVIFWQLFWVTLALSARPHDLSGPRPHCMSHTLDSRSKMQFLPGESFEIGSHELHVALAHKQTCSPHGRSKGEPTTNMLWWIAWARLIH